MADEKYPTQLEHLLHAVDSVGERLTQIRVDVAQHEVQIAALVRDIEALRDDFARLRRDVPNREHVEADLRRIVEDIGALRSGRPDVAISNLQRDVANLLKLIGPTGEDAGILPTQRKLVIERDRLVYGAAGVSGVGALIYFLFQVIEALRDLSGG